MTISRRKLTQKKVRELFDYNEKTGILTSRIDRGKAKKGRQYRTISKNGYLELSINNTVYRVHEIVWLWWHGYWPEFMIDHIDKIRHHNWITNLREVSPQCNVRNSSISSTNTTGIKGVYLYARDNVFVAQISVKYKMIYLGRTTCLLEAACLRLAAEQAEDWPGCERAGSAYLFVKQNIPTISAHNTEEESIK